MARPWVWAGIARTVNRQQLGCELHQFDCIKVHHISAHTFCRVEFDIRLARKGVAKDADTLTINDLIANAEVTKGNGKAASRNHRHICCFENVMAEEAAALHFREIRLPEV